MGMRAGQSTGKPGADRRQDHGRRNAIARNVLLKTAPYMRKYLGAFTGALAGNTRIKLFNVGLLTSIDLRVTMNYTIATAIGTLSGKGPHAAIQRIKLVDFDGSDRINISGFHLFLRNAVRNRDGGFGLNMLGTGNVITDPNVPTAIAANTGSFQLTVPVCANYDEKDLRGMMLMQTAVGEVYLSIDWASSLYTNSNDDFVFNGGATSAFSATSFTVEAWQNYHLPQAQSGGVQLPQQDLLTVYELAGMVRSTTDFAANTEKLVNLPNVREVLGGYHTYLHNSIFPSSANDCNRFRLIANGNNVMQDHSDNSLYWTNRKAFNGDISPYPSGTLSAAPRGVYLFDFKRQPIRTWLYGNVQQGFTPQTAPSGTTSLESTFESVYGKGTVLPGLGQAQ